MSGNRNDQQQQQPLLPQDAEHGSQNLDIDERQSSIYLKNATSGLSALTVQVCVNGLVKILM